MAADKPLLLTVHARDSVDERLLEIEWIEQAARQPEWTQPGPRGGGIERRYRTIPEFGNRVLRAACLETESEIRILTVFFDRRAKRPK